MTPQPISTAPIGQRILLYCQRKSTDEGWWQLGVFCLDFNRWVEDDCERNWIITQPTYWLPLPQPPQPQ